MNRWRSSDFSGKNLELVIPVNLVSVDIMIQDFCSGFLQLFLFDVLHFFFSSPDFFPSPVICCHSSSFFFFILSCWLFLSISLPLLCSSFYIIPLLLFPSLLSLFLSYTSVISSPLFHFSPHLLLLHPTSFCTLPSPLIPPLLLSSSSLLLLSSLSQ